MVGRRNHKGGHHRHGSNGARVLQVEAVLNEFVQMEKKTFMSEYEEGDAGDADFNLGGHGGAPTLYLTSLPLA